jgi:hypothetical protein
LKHPLEPGQHNMNAAFVTRRGIHWQGAVTKYRVGDATA